MCWLGVLMKKFVLFLSLLVFFSTFAVYAEEKNETESKDYNFVVSLIEENAVKNEFKIFSASTNLPLDQRLDLYEKYSRSAGLYVGINALSGFGIGSFIQGDISGGVFTCVLSGLSVAGIIAGEVMALTSLTSRNYLLSTIGSTMMITCGCMMVGGYIYSIIEPFVFSRNLNKSLARSLNLSEANLSMVPTIDPINKKGGVTMACAVKF